MDRKGSGHEVMARKGAASELLPRVHRVVALLKARLMGTHQGAVIPEHLDYCLDEFIFRFNYRPLPSSRICFNVWSKRQRPSTQWPTRAWSSRGEAGKPKAHRT